MRLVAASRKKRWKQPTPISVMCRRRGPSHLRALSQPARDAERSTAQWQIKNGAASAYPFAA